MTLWMRSSLAHTPDAARRTCSKDGRPWPCGDAPVLDSDESGVTLRPDWFVIEAVRHLFAAVQPLVTSLAELDALPPETVVIDREGLPHQRVNPRDGWGEDSEWNTVGGGRCSSADLVDFGPLTVLWRPDSKDRAEMVRRVAISLQSRFAAFERRGARRALRRAYREWDENFAPGKGWIGCLQTEYVKDGDNPDD